MGSSVDSAKAEVVKYQALVESEKRNKENAKRVGNYQRAIKNTRMADGKLVNDYDYRILKAQELLKRAKANLAQAKAKK